MKITYHKNGKLASRIDTIKNTKITYNENGNWTQTGPSERIINLEDIQSPYLTGLFDNLAQEGYSINAIVETDRGCPYKYSCNFY